MAAPISGKAWLEDVGLKWLYATEGNTNLPAVTQARLGYCWAHLAQLFPSRAEFARAAEKSFHSQPPVEGEFRVYDHSFYLLFMAWYFGLTGESMAMDLLRRRYGLIEQHLDDAGVGGFGPQPAGIRSHNPYMHLLEALLAAFRNTGDDYWRRQAGRIEELFFARLLDRETGLVFEFLNADWTPTEERRIEIGHQFEWSTLLFELGHISAAERLQEFAVSHGFDDGLAINTPTDKAKLLWVQTEAVKRGALSWDIVRQRFFRADGWSWYNRLNADGTPVEEAANPRLLYHVVAAAVTT